MAPTSQVKLLILPLLLGHKGKMKSKLLYTKKYDSGIIKSFLSL